jgi:pimeloyl-ACP methyl ester carboxylesterase
MDASVGVESRSRYRRDVSRPISRIALIVLVGATGGCAGVRTREATLRQAVRASVDRVHTSLSISPSTRAVLERHGLTGVDSQEAATRLEPELEGRPGSEPDGALALAELWYQEALARRHRDPLPALAAFRNAAAASAIAVSEPQAERADRAVEIHNRAVAHLIRLSQDPRVRCDTRWHEALARSGVTTAASGPFVDPARFASIEVSADVQVRGMRHEYRGCGIGVPVVALRPNDRANPREPSEAYFASRLWTAATVVAVPGGRLADGTWRTSPLALYFHDPSRTRTVAVGRRVLPMAFDTTTALAVQASQPLLSASTFAGLFISDFQSGMESGLYMLRPYQPGKVPVVFVHGLNTNPAEFVQALNELGNDSQISARYQFLLFAYPTGRPIPRSAYRLRRALYEAESKFGGDPAFHQMVLVGHSMGGNLTRFMVTESGTALWDAVVNVPPDQIRGSPEIRAFLTEALIFRPVPFVRRAVFIATPHRGSPIADEPFGRIVSRFIRTSREQTELIAELRAANGPNIVKNNVFRNRSINAIGNLSTRSPVLLAVDQLPIAPGVRSHSIIFDFLGHVPSDLVVSRSSSSLAGVESARVLAGTHFSQQSSGAVDELRRLLLDDDWKSSSSEVGMRRDLTATVTVPHSGPQRSRLNVFTEP